MHMWIWYLNVISDYLNLGSVCFVGYTRAKCNTDLATFDMDISIFFNFFSELGSEKQTWL